MRYGDKQTYVPENKEIYFLLIKNTFNAEINFY